MEVKIQDAEGRVVGNTNLSEEAFGARVRKRLLHDAVVMYEANKRVGTHATKTRHEVAGSGRKPWAQKHTGRARAGDKQSPLWRGGGIIFGPHPRDYSYEMPRKSLRTALASAVLSKFKDGEGLVIDGLSADLPKTKPMVALLKKLGITESCLVVIAGPDRNVILSVRNIQGVKVLPVSDLNAYEVLKHRRLLITKDGLVALSERLTVSKVGN